MTCLISLVPKECLGNDFGWFPKNVWEMNLVGQKDFEFHKYHKTKNPIKKIKSLVTCLQLTLKLKLQPLLPQLLKLKLVLYLQLQCHLPTK